MSLTLAQARSLKTVADKHGISLPALVAVVNVESNGQIFATDVAEDAPVIRWEGHYFYRLLKGEQRAAAVRAGLAAPEAGTVKNPKSQRRRYDMLERAITIAKVAALSSISIGVGQVMGSHWKTLGFENPDKMFDLAETGLAGQVDIMCRYIVHFDLKDELDRLDWSGFARGYNGPAYRKNAYHTKMAKAYAAALRLLREQAPEKLPSAATMLRMGSQGARVREVQQLLRRAGYAVTVDGDFGPSTKKAVIAFQKASKTTVDGVVGPKTYEALQRYKTSADEPLGKQPVETLPQTSSGTFAAGSGVGMAVVVEKVAEQIGADERFMDLAVNGFYMVAGALIVGGIAWMAWGVIKSKVTFEGTT